MARTIQSPGVQISEVDLSLQASLASPTNVLIPGFAPKGPTSEPVTVSTLSQFEQIFGTPTNSAERYFYQTTKAVFQSPANVSVYRLPYGTGAGLGYTSQYSALVYPVVTNVNNGTTQLSGTSLSFPASSTGVTYFFGQPTHITLSESDYYGVLRGNAFTWSTSGGNVNFSTGLSSLGNAGLIILNKAQASINSRFEGTYIGITDNTCYNTFSQYDDFSSVLTVNQTNVPFGGSNTSYVTVPSQRLTFPLSASGDGANGGISEAIEKIPTFDTSKSNFDDTINLGVFKLRQSVFTPDTIQLDYVLQEGYNASFDYYRQINNPNGGPAVSYFLGNVESSSPSIVALVNPYISNQFSSTWLSLSGVPNKNVRFLSTIRQNPLATDTDGAAGTFATRMGATSALYGYLTSTLGSNDSLIALGDYAVENVNTKQIGSVPTKLGAMFNLIYNADLYPLSIVCEAGLGTIYANTFNTNSSGYFDDSIPYTGTDFTNLTAQDGTGGAAQCAVNYKAVVSQFVDFAANQRKDHLFIADPLINIFVQNNVKVLDDPNNNFSTNVYWPLYNLYGFINNSYTAVYANAVQVPDTASSRNVWVPFSGFAAAAMANTDSNFQPWFAPAGFTRGVVNGITDVAIYPNQKQRDLFYKANLNPVAFFPNEGYVIYGQKTMSKLPSAFDRINVRRLFLTLETQTNTVARNYVFEPNTLFTRTQVKNVLTPIFDNAKNSSGIYDYLLICDERNNTPAVIDDNSLVIDIYIKPVRTAEFVLVNFYATRTSQNFAEIVS